MRQWYKDQLSRIDAFRTFLTVFFILHKPSLQRPRLKDLSAAVFILLGFFELGQAMRHLAVRPVITRPILSLSSRQTQKPPQAPSVVTPKEFYRAREGSTRPVMQWKNADKTVEIAVEGDRIIEKVIDKNETAAEELPQPAWEAEASFAPEDSEPAATVQNLEVPSIDLKPQQKTRTGWNWPEAYNKMLFSFLSLIGFSLGAASLLVKGDAPSLLRFMNCLVLVALFVWELYNFMEAPVYATEIQLFGAAILLASAGLLVRGCSLSYMDREYVS